MKLEGSCHCRAVCFSVETKHPYPFNQCYCSICRKTAGGGGYAINLSGDFSTLQVQGQENVSVYRAKLTRSGSEVAKESSAQRSFCRTCGSALWVWDPAWPELVHPFASAIDSDLPIPRERTHLMTGSKASWVALNKGESDKVFDGYPDESIAQWHARLGLESS